MLMNLYKFYETRPQFLKFLFIGGINTLFSYALFSVLIHAGLHYTLAVLFATCLGVLFNFQTTGKLVFKNTNNRLIIRFIAVYAVLYFVNIFIIKFAGYFLQNLYIRGLIATLICAVIAYLLHKNLVFKLGKV
ncbi:MAG: GtrA family protein [Gammaproteobacteria bacterium]